MFGVRIVEDASMVDVVGEDWSGCRSISRALRRAKRGHRQNVKPLTRPKPEILHLQAQNVLVMHPVTAAKLRGKLADEVRKDHEHALLGALMGRRSPWGA